MKMKLIVALAVAIMLVGPGVAQAAIENSKHDLSSDSTGPTSTLRGTTDQICIFCHAPHNADPGTQPLWNHGDPATTSWQMYNTTLNDTTPDSTPNTGSLRCLSCHDGATAVDAYGGASGDAGKKLTGDFNIGTDLSDDHPVSITYGGTAKGLVASPTDATLYSNKVECGSCHDPHDTTNTPFLRETMSNSALCQDCHGK